MIICDKREAIQLMMTDNKKVLPCIVKYILSRYILSNLLVKLMNLSVISGVYPSKLKHAKVIPVYKDDDETDLAN